MNEVQIQAGRAVLSGNLIIPQNAAALVLFAHGSGSSRRSPRNQFVARTLNDAGLVTLLFDLLTQGTSRSGRRGVAKSAGANVADRRRQRRHCDRAKRNGARSNALRSKAGDIARRDAPF